MIEKNIKSYYNLLNHKKQTEIRILKPSKDFKKSESTKSFFINSLDNFMQICKKYNKHYNIYVGINERTDKGTTSKDAKGLGTFEED